MSASDKYEVARRIAESGGSLVCPSCGGQSWQGFGDLGNLSVTLQARTPDGEIVAAAGQSAGLPAYVLACSICGFIRLHAAEVLDRNADN